MGIPSTGSMHHCNRILKEINYRIYDEFEPQCNKASGVLLDYELSKKYLGKMAKVNFDLIPEALREVIKSEGIVENKTYFVQDARKSADKKDIVLRISVEGKLVNIERSLVDLF